MSEETMQSSPTNTDAGFWDRMARRYSRAKVSDQAGYERTLQRTADLLSPDDSVLELGCGTGTTALRLAPGAGTYLGTDISQEMITIAREKLAEQPCPGLSFEVATAGTVSPGGDGFDAVLGFNYLHLVEDLRTTLGQVHGLLKPGGLWITKTACLGEMSRLLRVAVPLMRLVRMAPRNILWLDEPSLIEAMKATGFEIEAVERHASGRKDRRPFIVARRQYVSQVSTLAAAS